MKFSLLVLFVPLLIFSTSVEPVKSNEDIDVQTTEEDYGHPYDSCTEDQLADILEALNITKGNFLGDVLLQRKDMINLLLSLKTLKNAPHNKDTADKEGHLQKIDFKEPTFQQLLQNHSCKATKRNKRSQGSLTRSRRSLVDTTNKWNFPIQYYIEGSYDTAEKDTIRDGVQAWEDKTCATFQEVGSSPAPGITFFSGSGCYSLVGVSSGSSGNRVSLEIPGCVYESTVIHEIGHSLGFLHTQSRPDRDFYVTVNEENVQTDMIANYNKSPWERFALYNLEYDFASEMHYSRGTFSIGSPVTNPTMDAVNPLYNGNIGSSDGISYIDAKMFNIHYCSAECPGYSSLYWKDCLHGGYRDPNDCSVCRCPDGWSGPTCSDVSPPGSGTCGGEIDVTDSGFLSNPDFGSSYSQGSDCTWLLKAPAGSQIRINFVEDFGIEYSTGNTCSRDWVEIRYYSLDYVGPRFCGNTVPTEVIESLNGELMVLFRANDDNPNPNNGFKIQYMLVPVDNKDDVPKLELTGTGVCTNQRWREGIYCIRQSIRYNGYPVYKQMIGNEYLYFKNENWVVGPEVGGDNFGIQVNMETANLMCFDGVQWVTELNLALEESQLCKNIWASGLDTTGGNAALNGMYTRGEDGVYTKVGNTAITIYKTATGWEISTSDNTYDFAFGSTEMDITLVPNTWTIGSDIVKFECYFGPEPCERVFVDGSDTRRGNMGFFKLEGSLHQRTPLYIHEFGERHLYRTEVDSSSKFWVIGKGLTSYTQEIRVSTTALVPNNISPADQWEVIDGSWDNWFPKPVTAECVEASVKQPPCDEIFISINGDTGDVQQTGRLGLYKLQADEYKNRPAYASIGNTNYLFYTESGTWYISGSLGSGGRAIDFRQAVEYPQEFTVTPVGYDGSSFVPMTGVGVTCLIPSASCESVQLTSGLAFLEGTYSKNTDLYDERPTYKKDGVEKYIYYLAIYKRWNIGSIIGATSINALVSSIAMSPTDISPVWRIYSGSWQDDPTMEAACLDAPTTTTAAPTTTTAAQTTTTAAQTTTTAAPTTTTAAPTTTTAAPTTTTAAPTTTTAAPTTTTAAPTTTTAAPTTTTAAPTTTTAAPTTTTAAPTTTTAAPTTTTAAPTTTTAAPTTTTAAPTTTTAAPTTTTAAPTTTTAAPTTTTAAPTTTTAAPTTTTAAPTTTTAAPTTTTAAPTTTTAAPTTTTAAPTTTTAAPTTTTAAPTTTTAAPTTTTAAPTTTTAAPTTTTAAPTTTTAAPTTTTAAPTTTTAAPTTTTAAPTTTTAAPTTTTAAPTTTTAAPTTTTAAPTTTTAAPTTTTAAPTTTTAAPTTTTAAPTTTTAAPTTTTAAPTTTTAAPTTTTAAPTTTTAAPTTTTAAPTTTTAAPTTTTAAPTTTTAAPTTTTAAPTTTTAAPTTTTAAPTTTTAAPTTTTTAAPTTTTAAPTTTTAAPTTTTAAPTTTTAAPTTTTLSPLERLRRLREARKAARKAAKEARKAARKAAKEAAKVVRKARKEARKAARKARKGARKAVKKARKAAKRARKARRRLWRSK
ncbi:unnamed protein product [Owenia fusiformis]|uniref:Metalloendopeptidase n=1 Tax=Owenia fusiformis TaxID=6347 RepID=A0A8S4NPE2_OWEFU|nr:unnamed protein product [Owenia fusiformis]